MKTLELLQNDQSIILISTDEQKKIVGGTGTNWGSGPFVPPSQCPGDKTGQGDPDEDDQGGN